MSEIPQLLAAIDSRLAEIAGEITVLESAKAALAGQRTIGRSPAGATHASTARPRRPRRPRRTPSPTPTEPAASGTTPEPVISVHEDGSSTTPERSTAKRTRRRRRAGVAVGTETLKRLLADTSAGLSANAIAAQAGAGDNPTLTLLRKLEAAGQVRRSGSRRSTLWRLVTDEERIAERAAELERRRSMPSQQRRWARVA
jgi:hypothetical protein